MCATLVPLILGLTTLVYTGPGHLWWRGHAGDSLVVAFFVGGLGLITRAPLTYRLGLIGILFTGLELAQLTANAGSRGRFSNLVLGSTFDPFDFLYYALGLALAVVLDSGQSRTRL